MRHAQYRSRFTCRIGTIAALCMFGLSSHAQTPSQALSVRRLSDNVYWTQGGVGGNTGFIIDQEGVVVVDAKTTAESAKDVLAEIAKLTSKPVTHVILTHSDGDHVNGLAAFPMGLTIIAQENCKKEMENSVNSGKAALQGHLPTQTVDKTQSLSIGGVRIDLLHWAPAHTSGDLVVYLPQQKIVFTGDIIDWANPGYPVIHLEKNGTSEGWIETVKGILALDADTFVPGHGDLQTKADLQKRLANVEERRAKIKELVAQGKSLDEIKQALGQVDAHAGPGGGHPTFTDTTYTELLKN